jgi:hypothetical protein
MKYVAGAFLTPIIVTTALVLFRGAEPVLVIVGFVFGGSFGLGAAWIVRGAHA